MSNSISAYGVELLAPVGKWDVLEAVIAAGADAVYLGGKRYNMRLFYKNLNFDDESLRSAVAYAHEREVKVYVTVNNLFTNAEIDDLASFLKYLEEIEADGIIVQDLGVVRLAQEIGLRVPLHASVMMNAHSLEALRFCQELGIARVVVSRNASLADIKYWHEQSDLELEYFIHGMMCFSQDGQCYWSGMQFGQSSNRGRCLMLCRWPFELIDRETVDVLAPGDAPATGGHPGPAGPYFLATKDLCLLPFIPEMINTGICSLKIEGRLESAGYLAALTGFYHRALDRYAADPDGYRFDWDEFQELYRMRVRDFSPLYAFGNPGPLSIGYTGEREPLFFSRATREHAITAVNTPFNPSRLTPNTLERQGRPLLAVKVGSLDAALAALEQGADLIYTSGDTFAWQDPWHPADLARLLSAASASLSAYHPPAQALVVAGTPRITMPSEIGRTHRFLAALMELQPRPDGILAGNVGVIQAARTTGLPIYADFSCNVANARTAALLQAYGVVQATAALEFRAEEILALPARSPLAMEAVVHGQLPCLISDHCIPAALLDDATRLQICSGACRQRRFGLRDEAGMIHPLETDTDCRSHLFLAHELALLPYLRSLYGAGFHSLRLEIPGYNAAEAGAVTALYRANIDRLWGDPATYEFVPGDWDRLLQVRKATFGAGPYLRGVKSEARYPSGG
jgi:putative protease